MQTPFSAEGIVTEYLYRRQRHAISAPHRMPDSRIVALHRHSLLMTADADRHFLERLYGLRRYQRSRTPA